MSVKACSNGVFVYVRRYGKSPCVLRCAFLSAVDVDCVDFFLARINIYDLL
jgi:hypothetical protein